jgi:shikimate kinase
MGSGKSTLGRALAEKAGYRFIDMDERFEQEAGVDIPEFFCHSGEDEFRQKEHEMLKSLVKEEDAVIATGGGTPCHFDNMEMMNAAGITVYLKVSADELYRRLKDSADERPLLRDVIPAGLKAFIAGHLKERERYYLKARIVWDSDGSDIQGLIRKLL